MSIIILTKLDSFPDGKHPVFAKIFKKLSLREKIVYFNHLDKKNKHKKYCECIELLADNEIDGCSYNYEFRKKKEIESTRKIGGLYGQLLN